ncbi:MAG: DMT family transporter [Candidatus Sulfotelmatobacter sp.]
MRSRRPVMAILCLALAGSLWGTGFFFGKIALREMTVAENVAFRLLAGALVLLPIFIRRGNPYSKRDWGMIVLAAGIGVPVQFLVQFWGLKLTTVSHASLIVGVLPVLLSLSAAVFLHERLHAVDWGVLAMSTAGALLIALSSKRAMNGPQPSVPGDFLVLLSMFAAVVMVLCSKRLLVRYSALHVTSTMIVTGTVMLLVWVESTQPVHFHFTWKAWGAVIAQGWLATAGAYLFWNWGLARIPASRASVFLNLEPVVGTVLGVVLLHERLGSVAILGGALIVGAAVYFSLRPHHA